MFNSKQLVLIVLFFVLMVVAQATNQVDKSSKKGKLIAIN
jgi:hypothetical protein